MNPATMKTRTILRPDFPSTQHLRRGEQAPTPTVSDFIQVPRLTLQGVWRVQDLLSTEDTIKLAVLANKLEGKKTSNKRAMRRLGATRHGN